MVQRRLSRDYRQHRCHNLLMPVAAIAAFALLTGVGRAQSSKSEYLTDPILRIEAESHIGTLRRIDTDSANRFVVTASLDKTVRVWSLLDGRLLKILRLPLNPGDMGKAYAVALSPDGVTVAVGGFTSPDGTPESIFLYDRASGDLMQRLTDLPEAAVHHLAYSPDGRRLVASLGKSNGIRVFDAGDSYRMLPSDHEYGNNSYWADFDQKGRLVTASDDGFVRLYQMGHYDAPSTRFKMPGRPYSAVFSPDGKLIAVGIQDQKDVIVLSGKDLKKLYKVDTTGIPDTDIDMSSVGWSADGRFLFAGGYWFVDDKAQIRRWSNRGRGAFVDMAAGNQTIQEILPLKSGSMLFEDQRGVGLISPDAKVTSLRQMGSLDFASGGGHRLLISADGRTVQIGSWEPLHKYRFSLDRRQIDIDPPADPTLLSPVTEAPELEITNWKGLLTPAVNGVPLKLDEFEVARSVAVVPGTKHFVLGAQWSLHMFDQFGHELWPDAEPVPDDAWHVNVTVDGRLVVGAFGDGTIRWRRVSDGKEVLALFIHPDGQRWVVWTPQGYYDASVGGDELIGWHINHDYDHVPDFYPVAQFRDRFYRPDVIQRVLQTPHLDVDEAVYEADQTASRSTTKTVPVGSLLTPIVTIQDPKDPAARDSTDLELAYTIRLPSPDDSVRIEAAVDGAKVVADDKQLVDRGDTRAGVLHLTIPRRDSVVSLIAYNGNGASVPALVHVQWRGAAVEQKLNLYVLAIGISNYKDEHLQLHFAAKDADDFVALAKAQEGGLYGKVIMHPQHGDLRDGEATKDAILDELDWIMHAVTNTNDVAMVFLSGHGVTTPDQHYRFLPYDYDPDRVERTTISDSDLKEYLTKIGGKKIFFFDTCYSGDVIQGRAISTQPDVDKFANDLKQAQNGVVVFASSTGNELSQENDDWKNGAFTKAVVEGMRGDAARPGNDAISISDLESFVSKRVKELTHGNQRPMTAKPITVEDFWIAERLSN
jgi:WD40 repeat protein